MFRLGWLQKRGATRGMPRRDQARRRRWPALGLIACLALLQAGCQSGPSGSGCGLFSPCGFFSRASARVFNRSNGSADCCGPTIASDVPVQYGTPSAVVTSPAIPSYPASPGTTTVPTTPDTPDVLDAVPKSRIGPPPAAGTGASGLNNSSSKTTYQTRRPVPGSAIARSRNESVARTMVATPEPTSRSAQAASTEVVPAASGSDAQDPLDHLPPLDLPGEVTRSSASPPATPAVPVAEPKSADAPKNTPVTQRESSPSTREVVPTAAPTPVAEATSSASVGPGMGRFFPVDLKLAGGGAPSTLGLQWLVEKGYRTLLDLREPSEIPASFVTEVTNKGLRYIALPMSLKTIDRDHLDRFHFEIAAGEARPLFFFDSNGNRAGVLWYIRRIVVDRVDPQIARREAEELGLVDPTAWTVATDYVAKVSPPGASAGASAAQKPASGGSTSNNDASRPDTSRSEATAATQATDSGLVALAPAGSVPPAAPPAADSNATPEPTPPSSDSASPIDPTAWRPFAAILITGLSLPLAYWTRSVVPTILSKTRASLPGPGPRPKSLPAASDD